jgi:hypothetical protein
MTQKICGESSYQKLKQTIEFFISNQQCSEFCKHSFDDENKEDNTYITIENYKKDGLKIGFYTIDETKTTYLNNRNEVNSFLRELQDQIDSNISQNCFYK